MSVLAFNNTTVDVAINPINNTNNKVVKDKHRKYSLPTVDITNYNVLIDGRNCLWSLYGRSDQKIW